jgi:BirA family transcriptional regulator, biotin operon repressor / biotin---[acetyl-CoA-carboxylase] ligase
VKDLEITSIEHWLDQFEVTIGRPIVLKDSTESTNDDARKAAASGGPHGAVFLAESQTRGRGRSGHTWFSPPGENLYLSIILRPNIPPMALPPLTLVVGVCVARAVDAALGTPNTARIKWPNDIYVGEDKLSGILLETSLRGSSVEAVIAGIGLNVLATVFPPELRATSLRLLGAKDPDRSKILAFLLAELGPAVRLFEQRGFAPFHAELEARDLLKGRAVEINGIVGTAVGVDTSGFICVQATDGKLHQFGSGSVNFREIAAMAPSASKEAE